MEYVWIPAQKQPVGNINISNEEKQPVDVGTT